LKHFFLNVAVQTGDDRDHGDHGGYTDDHAQKRQEAAQFVGGQRGGGDADGFHRYPFFPVPVPFSFSFSVCSFTFEPSLMSRSALNGPVMICWPGRRPLTISIELSPESPVLIGTNFAAPS